jgi:replication-associated recombination protein RarA
MAIKRKKKRDDAVGYRRPPKHSQFKPGRSGNPRGRPKGAKNLSTELLEELHERVKVKEGGREKTISKQRAMLKSLMAKAVKGDTRAANTLLNMLLKLVHRDEMDAEDRAATKTDEQVLEDFKAALLSRTEYQGASHEHYDKP